MNDYSISAEKLHAYIDNQLAAEERAEVITALKLDPVLSRQVTELLELKQWVHLAYQDPPQLTLHNKTSFGLSFKRPQALAASLLLLLGGLTGWLIHSPVPLQGIPSFTDLAQVEAAAQSKHKVLIHISKMDKTRIDMALDKTELILLKSKQQHQPLQVEVVANAEGLALLRDDSPYGKRIEAIANRYDNIAFLACGIAMQTARLSEGIDEVKLLPQAHQVDAALEQILRRLKAGWAYVRG